MEREKIINEIGLYPEKTIFNVTWDRGNGELSDNYILSGFKDNIPILKKYNECTDLSSYSEVPTFDIFNKDIHIKNIEVLCEYFGPF